MKDKAYIGILIIGFSIFLLQLNIFEFDGGIGWALTSIGLILIGIGLRNPLKVLMRLFFEYL